MKNWLRWVCLAVLLFLVIGVPVIYLAMIRREWYPRSFAVALGDLDGDGDLDVFAANGHTDDIGAPNRIWLNNGRGRFWDSGQRLGTRTQDSRAVALGDLDGDGDLDAFVGNYNGPSSVWLNNGRGRMGPWGQRVFVPASETEQGVPRGLYSQSVALGDVDGDGDLDAYAAHSFGVTHNLVWLNDGSGFFVDSGQVLGSLQSHEVALGDLDGDGDLDAFVANGHAPYLGEPNKVWLNDGQGLFADSGQRLGYPTFNSDDSRAVALGDVDGDGDLDVFVGNDGPNQVWLNDGAGIYSYSEQDLGKDSTYTVVLEDLDGDDDLDVVVVNQDRVEVWLNDGRGWFVKGKQEIPHSGDDAVAVGDVDGDGDADILSMNYGRGCRVWLNDGDLQFSRLCDPRPALFWGCGVGLVVVCAAIWQRRRVHKFVN